MTSEWENVKLGNVTSKIGSGSTPRGGSKVYLKDGECALFRSQNVLNNSFSKNGLVYIDSEAAKKLQNVNIERSDVLLNITGDSVARVCKAPCEYLPARVNQHVAIIRTIPSKLDSSYLNYYLNSRSMQNYMLTIASAGATRNALTKGMIEDFDISVPPLQTQKKIAHILSTLDDKIELNRKMNRTLEEMAQALFKSWFVDFDPVHAKANASSDADFDRIAKELGISREILDLFPDEFEESELGMIPRGWDIKRLDDLSKVTMGQSPNGDSYNYNCNGLPLLNGAADFKDGILIPKKFTTDSKRKANHGELVFCIRATIGLLTYTDTEYSLGRGVASINAHNLHKELIYLGLDRKIERLKSTATGSVIIGLKKDDVESINFVVPNDDVMEFFHLMQRSIFDRIKINTSQTQALQKTRDTLIPKLLSGELDVSELELDNVTH